MSDVSFADVVHQLVSFSRDTPAEAVVLDLIDTEWMQRLRDISQTANTRLVYMFSEHSRFGHSVGVAYLANVLMGHLSERYAHEIDLYRTAVSAAALLHDVGHLAPGSHTAFKTWFPHLPDTHESIAARIINEDPSITSILARFGEKVPHQVSAILAESAELPAWTWEVISGGGWNVDRGNWCIVDSILAGVSYGKYNIPALVESIVLTNDKHLALRENRLDAMMHFALSRHAMYRQVYQHRVIISSDSLTQAIVKRAREVRATLPYVDDAMEVALAAQTPEELPLSTIFAMRESWWRYHLFHWQRGKDRILADLSRRLLNRDLFKTVKINEFDDREALLSAARIACERAGLDPSYYLHEVKTPNMHAGDFKRSMQVLMEDGRLRQLAEAEPLFGAMARETGVLSRSWLALPKEAKEILGRER